VAIELQLLILTCAELTLQNKTATREAAVADIVQYDCFTDPTLPHRRQA